MEIYKKNFTWNNLLDIFKTTIALFVALRDLSMALTKPLELGMLNWIANFININFSRCHFDLNVYTKKVGDQLTILVLFVDDLILTGSDSKLLTHVKTNLEKKF